MKQILIIITFFVSTFVFGQNREFYINTYEDGDTSEWNEWRTELSAQIELNSFQNADYNWYFRLWTNKQVIDVWEDINGATFGKLTNWTTEYLQSAIVPSSRLYYEKKVLNSDKTNKLISLIDSNKIRDIPDDSIDNWNWGEGLGRINFIVETSTGEDHFFRTYWTNAEYIYSHDALTFQKFAVECSEIAKLDEEWSDFASRIPFDCFINGGPAVTCRMSKKMMKKLKKDKEYDRHLDLKTP